MSENNDDQRLQSLFSTVVLHGYARVSPLEQNPDAQRDALLRAGVHPDQLSTDHTSGAKSSRPGWDALYKALRFGDVLVATRLDRVGRSTVHLVTLLDELARRGVSFRFLEQGIDTTSAICGVTAHWSPDYPRICHSSSDPLRSPPGYAATTGASTQHPLWKPSLTRTSTSGRCLQRRKLA